MKRIITKGTMLFLLLASWQWVHGYTPLTIDDGFTQNESLSAYISRWQGEEKTLDELVEQRQYYAWWQPIKKAGLLASWRKAQLKLTLVNASPQDKDLVLVFTEPLTDKFQVVQVNDRQVLSKITLGNQYPFHDRPIDHPDMIFPIHIASGESITLLMEVRGRLDNLNTRLSLWDRRAFFERNDVLSTIAAMHLGV